MKQGQTVNLFVVNGNNYMYNSNTNMLLSLSEQEAQAISRYIVSETSCESSDLVTKIMKLKLLSNTVEESLAWGNDLDLLDSVKFISESSIPQRLILEVTDRCNLRCKYCPYTTNTPHGNKRKHGDKDMSSFIAKSALHLYYDRYTAVLNKIDADNRDCFIKENPPSVGFYGGETLLAFSLVKELVIYFNALFKGVIDKVDISYTITTNLTLLTDDILNFCIENFIYLHISLDGPQIEHDKNRVFPNGKGSFNTVFNNLMKIKNHSENYYKEKVSIMAVKAPNYDSQNVHEFFSRMNDGKKFAGVYGFRYLDFKNDGEIIPEYITQSKFIFQDFEIFDSLNKSADIEFDISLNLLLKQRLRSVYDLFKSLDNKPQTYNPKEKLFSSCYIGFTKLFVSIDGNLYMCEKCDFSKHIGNITTGIDNNLVILHYKSLLEIYKNSRCLNCWAIRFCKFCPATFLQDGKYRIPKQDECNCMRNLVHQNFIDAIYIKMYCPNINKYLCENFYTMGEKTIRKYLKK